MQKTKFFIDLHLATSLQLQGLMFLLGIEKVRSWSNINTNWGPFHTCLFHTETYMEILGNFWFGFLQVKKPLKSVIKESNKKQWIQLSKRRMLPFILQLDLPITVRGQQIPLFVMLTVSPSVVFQAELPHPHSFRRPSCESGAWTHWLMSPVFLPLPQPLSRDAQPLAEDSADRAYGDAAGTPEWESKAWCASSPCNTH